MVTPVPRQVLTQRILEHKTKMLDHMFTPQSALIVSAVYYIPFAIAHIVQIPFAMADVFAMNGPHFGGVFGAFLMAHSVANLLVAGAAHERFKLAFLVLEVVLETFILFVSQHVVRRAGHSSDAMQPCIFCYVPWVVYANALLSVAHPIYKNWRETRKANLGRRVRDTTARESIYEGPFARKNVKRSVGRHATPVTRRYKYSTVRIDGEEFDSGLLDVVEALVERRGRQQISIEDTEYILRQIHPTYVSHYHHIEKRTIAYIRQKYEWTEAADEHLRTEIRKWDGEKAAITKRSDSFHND